MQCWISISSFTIPTRNYFGRLDSNDQANCVTDSKAHISTAVSHWFNEECLSVTGETSQTRNRNGEYRNSKWNSPQLFKSKQWTEIPWQMQSESYFWSIIFDGFVSYFHFKLCKTPSLFPSNAHCQALSIILKLPSKPKLGLAMQICSVWLNGDFQFLSGHKS